MQTTTLRLTTGQVARLLDAMQGTVGPLALQESGLVIHTNGSPHDTRDEEEHEALTQRLAKALDRLEVSK